MKRIALLLSLAVFWLVAPLSASHAQGGPLRAGVAKVDISPPAEMFPLAGMQDFAGVHDPLYARVLLLDNGATKVALVTMDAVGIMFGDDLVGSLTAALDIPPENLLLSATHAHNTPLVMSGRFAPGSPPAGKSPYFEIVRKGLLEAARQAKADLQPARIGFGTGKAYVNTNRNWRITEEKHGYYNPEGPSDKTVAVMLVTKPSGEPLAIYTNYAVHSVVMYQSNTKGGQGEVTSDLGGWTANYVEDQLEGVVALWTMGAAGDQNPLFMSLYNQAAPGTHDHGPAGWAILDVLSRRLGEETVRVARNIRDTRRDVVLWGRKTAVECPGRRPADPNQPRPSGILDAAYWDSFRMVDSDPVAIPLHLVMVNDIAIAGVSGEVFTQIGEDLKRESLFDRTFMVTNLPGGVGYIPSEAGYGIPVSETRGNRLKPGCAARAIVDGLRALQDSYVPVWRRATD